MFNQIYMKSIRYKPICRAYGLGPAVTGVSAPLLYLICFGKTPDSVTTLNVLMFNAAIYSGAFGFLAASIVEADAQKVATRFKMPRRVGSRLVQGSQLFAYATVVGTILAFNSCSNYSGKADNNKAELVCDTATACLPKPRP
jgi:hypothetical protein